MPRTVTVVAIEWAQITIVNVPQDASADIVVNYAAVMDDGSRQPRQWTIKVVSIVPDHATTGPQAKVALERILGYGIEQMEGQEGI